MREHRLREDVVEGSNLAIDGSSVRDVDERKSCGRKHVAGDDDVGAAEVHEAVAVGDGIWRPEELDGVAIVERAAPFFEICVRRHSVGRRLPVVHAVGDVLMTHDRRPDAGPRELKREEGPANAGIGTRRAELQIAACPVRMETRIGDELNGALAQPADGSNRLISEATGPCIDHERSLVANLHDDVAAISTSMYVVSNAQHVNLAVRGLGIDGHARYSRSRNRPLERGSFRAGPDANAGQIVAPPPR